MLKINYKDIPLFGDSKTEIEGLPELQGSPKQIKWAEDIRRDFVIQSFRSFKEFSAQIKKYYKNPVASKKMEDSFFQYMEERVSSTSAKWWIDHREMNSVVAAKLADELGWRKLFKK